MLIVSKFRINSMLKCDIYVTSGFENKAMRSVCIDDTALSSNVRDLKGNREELMKDDPKRLIKMPSQDSSWRTCSLDSSSTEGIIESAFMRGRGTADNKDSFDSILLSVRSKTIKFSKRGSISLANINARIERLPNNRYNRKLLVRTGLGNTFDSMDMAMVAFILPAVIALWSLSSQQAGVLGSSVLIGYFFRSLLCWIFWG